MSALARTPLYERHREAGARLVPFAGWEMPVQYAGVIDEVRAVRHDAGLFDVSHMGQLRVTGGGAEAFLQRTLSNDLARIATGFAQYTLLPNDAGGIVDDLIAYREDDGFLLVVNASNIGADVAHLRAQLDGDVALADESDAHAMLALQGPRALALLGTLAGDGFDAEAAPAFAFGSLRVAGVDCTCARTGYTGEPGVELICASGDAVALWDALVAAGAVPCGLGARDALRLEVCYPLHGQDITPETNALEAGLGWVCALGKEFTGVAELRRTRAEGRTRALVAFRMVEPRAIPRPGCGLVAGDQPVGTVTSGTFSPTLGSGIGMGYVPIALAEPGTPITVDVRGRALAATVALKPLYSKEI